MTHDITVSRYRTMVANVWTFKHSKAKLIHLNIKRLNFTTKANEVHPAGWTFLDNGSITDNQSAILLEIVFITV